MYNCPPPPGQQQPTAQQADVSGDSDSWEDMFDSGQLDQRLAKMDFSQPPPPLPANQMPGAYPRPPQGPQPTGVLPRMSVPPPNIRIMSRPQIQPRPSGGLRPSASGPPFARSAAPPQLDTSSSPFPSVPAPQPLQQHQISESGQHTPYKPPEPKLKILKRPGKEGGPGGVNGKEAAKPQPKSLKQREEEYAQARLRILGSAGSDHEEDEETTAEPPKSSPSKGKLSSGGATAAPSAPTVRPPKGPDGSSGFKRAGK